MVTAADYTLQQAYADIAELRGVIARFNLVYGAGGQLNYLGKDGNIYSTGQLTQRSTAAQSVTSTSFQALTGQGIESVNVMPGKYEFECLFRLKSDTTANTPGNCGFAGPAVTDAVWYAWGATVPAGAVVENNVVNGLVTINVLSGVAASTEYHVRTWGTANFSAGGLFGPGCIASSGHTVFVQPGSIFRLSPVT